MIAVSSFSGVPVGVLGLGKSGFVAAQALARGGAEVMAWDDDVKKRDAAKEAGVTIVDRHDADLAAIRSLGAGAAYVLEMSSYQLELTSSLEFAIAVLLNITPDHLGRHGGMDGYIAAKKRIFGGQRAPQAAIVGIDDPICAGIERDLARAAHQNIIPISAGRPPASGDYAAGGCLIDDTKGNATRILATARVAR